MKYQTLALAATTLLSAVKAFPKFTPEQLDTYLANSGKAAEKEIPAGCPFANKQVEKEADSGCPFAKNKKRSTFNAQEQYVSNQGIYSFVPPNFEAGDQRGPCPGLNALANHGYLPHNGVADMQTIIKAVNQAYGMSLDLGGFLAVYGTVFDGNPLSTDPGYSIGGPSKDSQNILNGGGILGTPSGLSGSHNKYESDGSATRGDLYLYGNNFHVQKELFINYYYNLTLNTPAPQQYTDLAAFHKSRFDDSVNRNPYFFFSPFAGVLVTPAAYSFPPRMMANFSEEYPDGYLSRETFASFFGVTGDNPDNFVVRQGWERIPDNWYKRPLDSEYSIPDFLVDVLEHGSKYPELLSFGGNRGQVNTYAAIDPANFTGGVYELSDLLTESGLMCFVFQSLQAASPDLLGSLYADVGKATVTLNDQIMQALGNTICPQLQSVDMQLFEEYPGYTNGYGSYAGLSSGDPAGIVQGVTSVLGGLIEGAN